MNIVEEQINAIDTQHYREIYRVYVGWCSVKCDYTLSELASDHDDKWNIYTWQYRMYRAEEHDHIRIVTT